MKMSTDIVVVDLSRGSIDVAGVIEKFYDLIHDGVICNHQAIIGEES